MSKVIHPQLHFFLCDFPLSQRLPSFVRNHGSRLVGKNICWCFHLLFIKSKTCFIYIGRRRIPAGSVAEGCRPPCHRTSLHTKTNRRLQNNYEWQNPPKKPPEIILWEGNRNNCLGAQGLQRQIQCIHGFIHYKGLFFLSLNTSFVWTNDSTLRITVHEITSHEAFWRCSEGRAHFLGEEGVHFTLLSGRIGQRRGEIFYYFYYSYLCADAAGGWVQGWGMLCFRFIFLVIILRGFLVVFPFWLQQRFSSRFFQSFLGFFLRLYVCREFIFLH